MNVIGSKLGYHTGKHLTLAVALIFSGSKLLDTGYGPAVSVVPVKKTQKNLRV
jgi:hypothetical protein